MKIKSDSSYSDGHESIVYIDIPDDEVPEGLADIDMYGYRDDLHDFLYPYSGDGHGAGNDLGFFHVVTIVEAANSDLVGMFIEVDG